MQPQTAFFETALVLAAHLRRRRLEAGLLVTWARPMLLSEFPPEKRAEIERLVAAPKPPPKWLLLCDGLAAIPSRAWAEWYRHRGRKPGATLGGRPKIPTFMRWAVIDRNGNECGICGDPVEEPPHIDHIVPVACDGPTEVGNLQIAHPRCNMRKGANA